MPVDMAVVIGALYNTMLESIEILSVIVYWSDIVIQHSYIADVFCSSVNFLLYSHNHSVNS